MQYSNKADHAADSVRSSSVMKTGRMRFLCVVTVVLSILCQGYAAALARIEHSVTSCQMTQTGCNYVITMKQHNECERLTTANQSIMANNYAEIADVIINKLNSVQDKLARMIKELSVRTLRHTRQIKTNLHKVRIFNIT